MGMKRFILLLMVLCSFMEFLSCSNDSDEYPRYEIVTQESLDGSTWYSVGVYGIIGFKGNRIAYRTYKGLGASPKHFGTYRVDGDKIIFVLDGENSEKVINAKFYFESKYSNKVLLLSSEGKIYDEFPYGECSIENDKKIFD